MPEAPQRRDVISSILNDYGGYDDEEAAVSPYVVSPVALDGFPAENKTLSSPTMNMNRDKALPDKPLPPVMMGFQLRAGPAGVQTRSPDDHHAQEQQESSAPSSGPSTIVVNRSLDRSGKPASLKLKVTNGSTAGSITHSASSSLASNSSGDTASSLTEKRLPDRPLPGLPPAPPEKSLLRSQPKDMGNKGSKAAPDKDGQQLPSSPPAMSIKRKGVPGSASRPTLADTMMRGQMRRPSDPASELPDRPKTSNTYQSRTPLVDHSQMPQRMPSLDSKVPSARFNMPRSSERDDSYAMAPSESATDARTYASNPTINTILPSPSPLPEDSPSKYGLRQPGSYMDTPPTSENSKPKKIGHTKGKSSTGFDIFRSDSVSAEVVQQQSHEDPYQTPQRTRSNTTRSQEEALATLHHAQSYLQNMTPSPTPLTLDFSNQQSSNQKSQSEHHLPHPHAIRRPGTPDDGGLEFPVMKFPSSPNCLRPAHTNAPHLNLIHLNCYWQHRRFNPSRSVSYPVACMLCYETEQQKEWWTCGWCALRICGSCRTALEKCPRRSIQAYVDRKRAGPLPVQGNDPHNQLRPTEREVVQ